MVDDRRPRRPSTVDSGGRTRGRLRERRNKEGMRGVSLDAPRVPTGLQGQGSDSQSYPLQPFLE